MMPESQRSGELTGSDSRAGFHASEYNPPEQGSCKGIQAGLSMPGFKLINQSVSQCWESFCLTD